MPFFPRFHYPAESTAGHASLNFPTDFLRFFNDEDFSASSVGRRAFSPNFDVHETEHEYILDGELPGLGDKKNVSIEFTDDKTVLVRGKIERSLKGWSDDLKRIENDEEQKKLEGGEQQREEGEGEGEGGQKWGVIAAEKRPKFWVSERSVGEFSRSFSFPGMVDVDRVKASLDNGILRVIVPKMEKRGGRKIEVN